MPITRFRGLNTGYQVTVSLESFPDEYAGLVKNLLQNTECRDEPVLATHRDKDTYRFIPTLSKYDKNIDVSDNTFVPHCNAQKLNADAFDPTNPSETRDEYAWRQRFYRRIENRASVLVQHSRLMKRKADPKRDEKDVISIDDEYEPWQEARCRSDAEYTDVNPNDYFLEEDDDAVTSNARLAAAKDKIKGMPRPAHPLDYGAEEFTVVCPNKLTGELETATFVVKLYVKQGKTNSCLSYTDASRPDRKLFTIKQFEIKVGNGDKSKFRSTFYAFDATDKKWKTLQQCVPWQALEKAFDTQKVAKNKSKVAYSRIPPATAASAEDAGGGAAQPTKSKRTKRATSCN